MSELERQLTEALKRLSEQYEREQRIARGPNPGRKSANYLQGCTICVSCRGTGSCWNEPPKRENRTSMAGVRATDLDAESRSAGCSFDLFRLHYNSFPEPIIQPAGLTHRIRAFPETGPTIQPFTATAPVHASPRSDRAS